MHYPVYHESFKRPCPFCDWILLFSPLFSSLFFFSAGANVNLALLHDDSFKYLHIHARESKIDQRSYSIWHAPDSCPLDNDSPAIINDHQARIHLRGCLLTITARGGPQTPSGGSPCCINPALPCEQGVKYRAFANTWGWSDQRQQHNTKSSDHFSSSSTPYTVHRTSGW